VEISPEILNLVPYKPGKPIEETKRELGLSQVYKLASNENPLGLSPGVKKAIISALDGAYRYPDASFFTLKAEVSKYYQVDKEWLSFGNGSNEIIDLLIRLFCNPGNSILTSQYAFVAYKICAQVSRVKTIEVEMTTDMKFNLGEMAKSLRQNYNQIRLVFIANPNNPTGTYVSHDQLEEFIQEVKKYQNTMVVLDEAYNEFVRAADYPRSIELMMKYENLIVMRTFSKVFGMAGLRLGTLIASPQWIELYNRIRNPFNVNILAQAAAVGAITDIDFIKRSQNHIWQSLDYFYGKFEKLNLKYWPSQGNFILVDFAQEAAPIYEKLLAQGIIARPVAGFGLTTCLRISVGLEEENRAAVAAIKNIV